MTPEASASRGWTHPVWWARSVSLPETAASPAPWLTGGLPLPHLRHRIWVAPQAHGRPQPISASHLVAVGLCRSGLWLSRSNQRASKCCPGAAGHLFQRFGAWKNAIQSCLWLLCELEGDTCTREARAQAEEQERESACVVGHQPFLKLITSGHFLPTSW